MALRYVSGDIFHASSSRAFAVGCNAAGTRGRGMSADVFDRWPDAYTAYRVYCTTVGHLGGCFVWQGNSYSVFDLIVQKTWKSRPDLTAIRVALSSMIAQAQDLGIDEISVPRVGTGLQGLDWPDVRDVIKSVAEYAPVAVTVFDRFVADQAPY